VLQVDGERPPAATGDGVGAGALTDGPCPVDAHDFGAHVGEQHPAEGTRADSAELDHLHAVQRSHMSGEATGVGYQEPPPPPPPPPPEKPPPPENPLPPDVDGGVDVSVPALETVKLFIVLANNA